MAVPAELLRTVAQGPPAERNLVGASRPGSERARRDLELLVRYRRFGDMQAREELVARVMPVVRQLARRYERGAGSMEDLVQVGCVGLVKAMERFDLDRGLPFLRYAVPTMLGEIKRHFRDTGWCAHVPRGMQERVMEVKSALDAIAAEQGRSPKPSDVAERLGLPVEEVLEALEASTAYGGISLDAPAGRDDDGDQAPLGETFGEAEAAYELVEDVAAVGPALAVLPEREREILRLRFQEDLTQSEIAERIGVSQMHVSRLLRRALERVRKVAENERVSRRTTA